MKKVPEGSTFTFFPGEWTDERRNLNLTGTNLYMSFGFTVINIIADITIKLMN